MTGCWTIEQAGRSSRRRDEVSRLKTDLTELEVLVREVLQNSLDAGLDTEEGWVRVCFRLRMLAGDAKAQFLEALGIDTYREQALLSREYEIRLARQARGSRKGDPVIDEAVLRALDPKDPATPLRLLFIEDFGATGLTGHELDNEAVSRFCACCRDAEFSVKRHRESGGSYGKGKNVLWRHARSRLVLFSSRLAEPFKGESSRFIGVGKLPWHAESGDADTAARYTGRCDLGDERGHSLVGNDAKSVAEHLGLPREESGGTGTSVCLVAFDPIVDLDGPDVGQEIRRITETYYWPAIHDGRLEVTIADEDSGECIEARPDRREDLLPFVEAYQCAREGDPDHSRLHLIRVPPRESGGELFDGPVRVAVRLLDAPYEASATPPSDCVALIRGFGMVVRYHPVRPQSINARNYVAVCLAGRAGKPPGTGPADGDEAAYALESMLSYSEPEAHDRWDPLAFQGTGWRGAQSAVKKLHGLVRETVTEIAAGTRRTREGDIFPELSKRFRLSGGRAPVERNFSIRKSGEPALDADGRVRFPLVIDRLRGGEGGRRALELRFQAMMLDEISGLKRRSEAIPVSRVERGGEKLPFDSRRGAAYTLLEVDKEELPLRLTVSADPPGRGLGETVHFGLRVACADRGQATGGD